MFYATQYPLVKRESRIICKIINETATNLKYLPDQITKSGIIRNNTNAYLGIEDKVPVKVGRIKPPKIKTK